MHPTGHAGPPPRHNDRAGRPTTTHAEWGAGAPRLVISSEGIHHTFALTADHVRIGSAPGCELQLDGVDRLHAEVLHNADDEFVLVLHGVGQTSAGQTSAGQTSAGQTSAGQTSGSATAHGPAGQVLRTGAQFVLGPWRFVFMRAEFADHGRPYGGREGGEGAHQRPQQSRPDYQRLHPTSEDNARAHTRTEG